MTLFTSNGEALNSTQTPPSSLFDVDAVCAFFPGRLHFLTTHHGAVAGRRDALPVLAPLTAARVGRAAGAVGEADALLV